ncbi:heavy-metal-associated domain-containing protein [Halomicroarcula limicola]|uniref:Heavy-metal-associated domain-containing protein n=1 Tax=Haloarcula limicola TaxID=1429915 RepID=A0A8J7Y7H9_9EURY|nr:heavy metal-associated domain-containing protein [Halomicroarcula limicola]MBV0925682.1 heavy-metal-associated domain-containing protein [Halomicroarcula limicola]
MRQRTLAVTGMEGAECENTVEGALTGVAGVESAAADRETGEVTVESDDDVEDQSLFDAITDAGYDLVGRDDSK